MTPKQCLALLLVSSIVPSFHAEVLAARANPIRRVVNMLQAMQKKVTSEGEDEEKLFNKFMCYCKTGKGDLEKSVADAETKGPSLASSIEESSGEKEQLKADLKAHKADRASAKQSVSEAKALREKAAAAYAASNAELIANTKAINKAVAALEKGMGGAFLQTDAAQAVLKLVESRDMVDDDRQSVLGFLSSGQASDYAPQSGQITGILKQLANEMSNSAAEETAADETAAKEHESLIAAKAKEIDAHTKAIEEKSVRAGEVSVSIVNMKDDLKDTQASLEEDKAFLAQLEKGCSTKESEWEERQKTRAEELVALAETIKLLNSDESLDLFKKALPTPETSFLQVTSTMASVRARALTEVRTARRVSGQRSPNLDLIALALHGKGSFDKVNAMIDEMVEVLKGEQQDDDKKKDYCGAELDQSDDKKKGLERTVSDEEAAASSAAEGIATLTEEVKDLAAGIKELDKSVAQATEQRKQEHAEYTELMATNTQAKELLGIARNRLNKFYSPSQYIKPKDERTQEDKIYQTVVPAEAEEAPAEASFVQIAGGQRVAPPPAPETFGDYSKKSEESSGVVAMVDTLVRDLDKEMTEAETSETNSQADYESTLEDAKAKRSADSKSISHKEGSKADREGELQSHKDEKAAATKELMATAEYISGLHGECDWLVENHEARKAARASEVESLKNAKAVLSGADYSLVQLRNTRHLRGRA